MRFRRIFKNVPARRWYPRWRLFDMQRRDLKEIVDILNETNEILDEMPAPKFRPVREHPTRPPYDPSDPNLRHYYNSNKRAWVPYLTGESTIDWGGFDAYEKKG